VEDYESRVGQDTSSKAARHWDTSAGLNVGGLDADELHAAMDVDGLWREKLWVWRA